MKTRLIIADLVLAVASLLYSSSALAVNEQLSFSQSPDSSVLATLTGGVAYCGDSFVGSPTFSISGNDITVTSQTVFGECPQPPPGFIFPPPTPYSFTVNLGHLPDGTFHVTWQFVLGANSVWKRTIGFFVMSHDALVAVSVPMLTPLTLRVLAVALASIAFVALGRSPGA